MDTAMRRARHAAPWLLVVLALSACSSTTPPASLSSAPSQSVGRTPASLPSLPAPSQAPITAVTLMPTFDGSGPATLPTVVPQGTLYVEVACSGGAALEASSGDARLDIVIQPCVGEITTVTVPTEQSDLAEFVGKPLKLQVSAQVGWPWRVYIADDPSGA
jgi:hypothetical protein